ncbi:hypothetical protein [Campylobacter vulpis]|uniref:hypothetical protein n=1 Tax=Campylobacter vulpis TaxID=1655500 RepID=UPI002079B4FA|nr:hypothetical protein [Campylobacter vulpis]
MTLEQFVKENITAFNQKPRGFKNSLFNEMQIKKYKENWDIIKQIASKKLP